MGDNRVQISLWHNGKGKSVSNPVDMLLVCDPQNYSNAGTLHWLVIPCGFHPPLWRVVDSVQAGSAFSLQTHSRIPAPAEAAVVSPLTLEPTVQCVFTLPTQPSLQCRTSHVDPGFDQRDLIPTGPLSRAQMASWVLDIFRLAGWMALRRLTARTALKLGS